MDTLLHLIIFNFEHQFLKAQLDQQCVYAKTYFTFLGHDKPVFTNIHDSAAEGQYTGNWTRSVDFSLIHCLFRIVKCNFTEPLYKSAMIRIVIITNIQNTCTKCKWEGRNLTEKKTRKYRGCRGFAFLYGYVRQYYDIAGYRDSPTDTVGPHDNENDQFSISRLHSSNTFILYKI